METEIHSNLIASEISKYHHILPHEYPLFQNYQLLGDSQFVRFSELFLNCKRQYHQNSSGRVGYCISGQTAQQLSHHLEQKFWPVYKNVILLIGTNDINNNTDPTQWKETIDKIVTCLSQLDVDNLIMLSVPPVPKLWHTILHWTLYVEYNDILKNIEGVYKNKFKFIRFLDITSIFFDKTAPSPSLHSSCLDLYVASPVREGCTSYDADFMMSGVPRQSSLESKRKDTSYLKQSISLFDAMNMRYKLMTCFFGQTNEQDVSINKERFDLIGVTLNDVRNIKSNLLAVYNEEYMFTLRHAFQKFIGHVREDQNAGKRGSRGSPEYSNPRKVLRTDLLAYTGDDLETCGVLCRSFDSSSDSKVPTATSQVSEQIPTDIFPTVNEKSQLGAKVPLKIKSEISLKRSSSPNASQPSKKRNSDNIWIELSSDNGNNTALGGNSSQSGNCGKFSQCSYSVTVSTNENSSEASRKVTSNLIPTTVVLKQRSREAIPELSSASTSTGSNEGNVNPPATGRTRRERSFRDVLGSIQKTLKSCKLENEQARVPAEPCAKTERGNEVETKPSLPDEVMTQDIESRSCNKNKNAPKTLQTVCRKVIDTESFSKVKNEPKTKTYLENSDFDEMRKLNCSKIKNKIVSAENDFVKPERTFEKMNNTNYDVSAQMVRQLKCIENLNSDSPLNNNILSINNSTSNNSAYIVEAIENIGGRLPVKTFARAYIEAFEEKQENRLSNTDWISPDITTHSSGLASSGSKSSFGKETANILVNPKTNRNSKDFNEVVSNLETQGSQTSDSTRGVLHLSPFPGVSKASPSPVASKGRRVTIVSRRNEPGDHNPNSLDNCPSITNSVHSPSEVKYPGLSAPIGRTDLNLIQNNLRSVTPDKLFKSKLNFSENDDMEMADSENDFFPRNRHVTENGGSLRISCSNFYPDEKRGPYHPNINLIENDTSPMKLTKGDIDKDLYPTEPHTPNNHHVIGSKGGTSISYVLKDAAPNIIYSPYKDLKSQPNNTKVDFNDLSPCEIHTPKNRRVVENKGLISGCVSSACSPNNIYHSETAVDMYPSRDGLSPDFVRNDLNSHRVHGTNYERNDVQSNECIMNSNFIQNNHNQEIPRRTEIPRRSFAPCDPYLGEVPRNEVQQDLQRIPFVENIVSITLGQNTHPNPQAKHPLNQTNQITIHVQNRYVTAQRDTCNLSTMVESLDIHDRNEQFNLNRNWNRLISANRRMEPNQISDLRDSPPDLIGELSLADNNRDHSRPPSSFSNTFDNVLYPVNNEQNPNVKCYGNLSLGALYPAERFSHEKSLENSYESFVSVSTQGEISDASTLEIESFSHNNYPPCSTPLSYTQSKGGSYLQTGKLNNSNYMVNPDTMVTLQNYNVQPESPNIPFLPSLATLITPPMPLMDNNMRPLCSIADAPMLPDDLKSCPTGALSKKVRGNHTRDETDYSDLCGKSVWKASSLERANNTEEADVLRIDYLTQDEKQDLDERFKKRERKVKDKRDRILDGYDKSFMARANTIQFYQYVQRVCRYQTNNDTTPLQEKAFAMHMRNMRSNKVSKLEAKFHMSMLGRYEFYKFIKYIALDFIVPKMFPGKYKKVMLTSVVDKERNVEKYIVHNLDVSVFETHYSRYPNSSSNKSPKIDLVHLNQQGFELLKDNLTEVITQMQREDSSP